MRIYIYIYTMMVVMVVMVIVMVVLVVMVVVMVMLVVMVMVVMMVVVVMAVVVVMMLVMLVVTVMIKLSHQVIMLSLKAIDFLTKPQWQALKPPLEILVRGAQEKPPKHYRRLCSLHRTEFPTLPCCVNSVPIELCLFP